MIFGTYRKGNEAMPRVMHIAVARYNRNLPKQGEPLEFLVAIHEEGTGITWQQNVTVDAETEQYFLDARNRAIQELGEVGDLTGYSAVLFGDAASQHQRDLAMAD